MEKSDFIMLDQAMVRDWLRQQIKIYGMQKASCRLNDTVHAIYPLEGGIHMWGGIGYVADLLGLELQESYMGEKYSCPWEYSFMYEGNRFFQIEKERLAI